MKKIFITILILSLILLTLTACGSIQSQLQSRGIEKAFVNDSGYLVLVYTDGAEESIGYVKGQDGTNGVDGIDGKDGIDGRNGRDGLNGIDGKDGVDGKDGRDGIDGRDGKDGEKGEKGDTGAAGKDGKDGKDGQDYIEIVYVEPEPQPEPEVIVVSRNITYADSDNYYELITTPGTHFDYLAIYNCEPSETSNTYNNFVLGCYKELDNFTYCPTNLLGGTPNMMYLNYSCFNFVHGEDYLGYKVSTTDRTTPGRYLDPETGIEYDWADSPYGFGVYILENVTVMAATGSLEDIWNPQGQTILVYENVYTPLQLLDKNN